MWLSYLLSAGVCFLAYSTVTGLLCDDIDTQACQLIHTKRPDMCNDTSIAYVTCPRFCSKCALECYHCDTAIRNIRDCNTTKPCNQGEVCMLKELASSIDGHHEYVLTCESKAHCDGSDLTFEIFGKRDVRPRDVTAKCCNTDLCNYPARQTSTVTSPKPTSQSGCLKDVLLLVDESSGMLHYRHDILDFLAHLVDHFDVSQHGTHVSLATYSTTAHQQFALDSYYNDNDMEHAIKAIHFRGGSSDTNVGLDYILKHAATPQAGDRLNVPDTVVIVTSSVSSSSLTYVNEQMLHQRIPNVIVLGIGHHLDKQALQLLATDSGHVLKVEDPDDLDDHRHMVTAMICS